MKLLTNLIRYSISVLSVLVFVSHSDAQVNAVPWQGIRSYKGGYTLYYPTSDWSQRLAYFKTDVPAHVITEKAQLICKSGAQISVDVWNDDSGAGINDWIDTHYSILEFDLAETRATWASRDRLPAVQYDYTSESGQSFDSRWIFFKQSDRVFRIAYLMADQGASDSVFQHVVSTFSFDADPEITAQFVEGTQEEPEIQVYSCGGRNDDCICGSNNPYPCCDNGGNCTWWAWDRACCLWGDNLPSPWRDAKYWATDLGGNGYTVSATPAVNTIGCRTIGTYGHVAMVIQVSGSQVQVTEMNCCTGCNYGDRTVWYDISYFNGGYIYPQGSSPTSITVNYPNGGETWYYNQSYTITWSTTGTVGNVLIHLYSGSPPHGSFLRSIAANTANTHSYAFTVPCDIPSASNYYVGMAETDGDPSDFSNGPFTITGSNPAAATNLVASDNRCDGVQLTWTDNSTWETEYRVYRNGGLISTRPANSTSYLDTPSAGTYSYYVVAAYPCGASGPSNSDNGTRLATPAQVTGVQASDNNCSYVLVTWSNLTGETGFNVYRNGVLQGSTGTDVLSYTDNTATAGVTYSYYVVAYNSCGDGPQSNQDTGYRLPTPGQVTGVSATDGLCTGVTITWNNISNESGYTVSRNGGSIGTTSADVTTYQDNSAVSGTVYSYTVAANNSCGTGPQSNADNGWRGVSPPQVNGVVATDDLCPEIIISWNNITGETGYNVYRNTNLLVSVSADVTLYSDQTATPGVSYSYTVAAVSSCGTGPQSNPDMGLRRAGPGQVTGLTASDDLCEEIVVTWNDVAGEDGYFIYQNMVLITSAPANVTTYTHSNALPGVYYFYAVRAYSTCDNGPMSNEDVGRAMPVPGPVQGVAASDNDCDGILITWQDLADEQAYVIYRDGTSIGTFAPDQTSHFDEYAVQGVSHSYSLAALTSCDEGPMSDPVTGIRPVGAEPPTSCSASEDDCDHIWVTWTDNSSDELAFIVYRNGVVADTVEANVVQFYDGPPAGSYAYTVRAYSDCGSSGESNSDSGTRLDRPAAPLSCTASDTSCVAVFVSWVDTAVDEIAYEIYRNGLLAGTALPNASSFVDYPNSGAYSYTVRAVNACGYSDYSNAETGTLLDAAAPPTNCQASDTSCSMIAITWTDNSNNENRFYIYRNGIQVGFVGANVTSYYLFSGAGSYEFRVRANTVACGLSAPSNSDSGRFLTEPVAPFAFSASDTSALAVYLNWNDVESESGYAIYRNSEYLESVSADVTSFVDFPPDFAVNNYCVSAFNQCGESQQDCDVGHVEVRLQAPENMTLHVASGWLRLHWKALRDTEGNLIPSIIYNLHRASEPDFSPSEATYIASTQDTLYIDLPIDERAFYRVVAEELAR
jgi:surface antigen/fibronectin type 3 domain-containing protein